MSGFSLDSLKNIGRAAVERGQAERLLNDNILAGYNPDSSEEFKSREELTRQRVTAAEETAADMSAATTAYNEGRKDPNRIYLTERTSKTDKALDMTAGILGGVASFAGGLAQNFVSDPESVRAISGTVESINEGLKGMRSDRSIQDQRIQGKQLADYRTQLDRLIQDGSITSGQAEMEMFKQTFKTSTVDTNISLVGQGIGSLLPMLAGGVALKAVGVGLKTAAISQYGMGVASAFGSTKEQILQELDSIPDSDWSKSEFAQGLIRDYNMSYEDAIEATKAKAVEDGYMSLANLAQAGISGAVDKFVVTKAGGLGNFFKGFITKPVVEAGEELFQSTVQTAIANTEYIEKAGEAGDGRDTIYGMGQGSAEGIIGGLGAGAGGHAMGTTTAVAGATMQVTGDVVRSVKGGVSKARDVAAGSNYEKNAERRNETITSLEETAPEQAAQARDVFDTVDAANTFDFESDTEGLTENVKEALKDKAITNPSDFADAMLEALSSGGMNAEDTASMLLKMDELQEKTAQAAEKASELANNKEANPSLRRDANNAAKGLNARTVPDEQLGEVRSQIQENAATLDTAIDEAADPATNQAAAKNIATIISVGDVQGKAAINLAPLLKQVDLHGAEALGLTDNQVQAMRAVRQMLESNPAYVEALRVAQNDAEGGKKNRTTFSVLFGDNEYQKGRNGVSYIAGIYTQLSKGNVEGAKALLTRLENFARNQANKAAALEKAIETGKSQKYVAYSYETGKPVQKTSTVQFGSDKAKTREDKERQTQSLLNTVRSEGNILQSIFTSLSGIINSEGDSFSVNNELHDIQTEVDQGSSRAQRTAASTNTSTEPDDPLAPMYTYDNEADSVNDAPVSEDRGETQPQTQSQPQAQTSSTPSPQVASAPTQASSTPAPRTQAAPMENASTNYNTSTAEDGTTTVSIPNSPRVYTISPEGDSLSVRSERSGRVVNIDINNPQPAVAGFVGKLKQDGLLQESEAEPDIEVEPETLTEIALGKSWFDVELTNNVYTFTPQGKNKRSYSLSYNEDGSPQLEVTSANNKSTVVDVNNPPKSFQSIVDSLRAAGLIPEIETREQTGSKKKSVAEEPLQNRESSTSEGQPSQNKQDSTSEAEAASTIQEAFPGVNPNSKFAKWNKVLKKSLVATMATARDIERHISNALKSQTDNVKATYSHLFRPTPLNNNRPMYSQIRDGLDNIISEISNDSYVKKLQETSREKNGFVDPSDVDASQKARILEFASYDPETGTWALDRKVSSLSALTAIDTLLNFQEHTDSGFDRDDNIFNSPIYNIEQALLANAEPTEDGAEIVDLAAKLFAVKEGDNFKYPAETLMGGLTLVQLENAISTSLRTMLGVSPNRDGSVFEANTSIQTLALAVINSMIDSGFISRIQIDGNDVNITNRKLNVYYVNPNVKEFLSAASKEGGINRSIIKQAFTGKTESGITFDPSELDVSTTVNRSNLKLGKDSQAAIAQAQKTKHYLDTGMFGLLGNIGKQGLLYLFGGYADGNTFYAPMAATLKGRDITVGNAWQAALDTFESLKGKAAELGETDLSKVPMFYKFGMSVVSRLSPIGAYTPVSDTTMRELIVATKGDVSLSKHGTYLKLAFAQGLDIGIEKKTIGQTVGTDPNAINGELAKLLNKLPRSIEIMRSYLSNPRELTPAELTDLRQEMVANGLPLKPRTTKTLYEYAKYLDAIERGADTYDSSLYIEADGISNGYVMANAMYAANLNDKTWLEVLERGGITLGQVGKAYADFLGKEGSFDNYKGIANATSEAIENIDNFYRNFPVSSDYQSQLLNKAITRKDATLDLIGMLLGDIEIIDGEVIIQRGQVKDDATKTNYGAGNKSKSKSIAKALTDKITENINEAHRIMAQGMYRSFDDALAAAFFPKEVSLQDSKNKFSLLRNYLEGTENGLLNGFNTLVYPKDESDPFVADTKVKDGNSVVRFNINFNANARTVIAPAAFEHLAANVERAFTVAVTKGQEEYNPVLADTMENLKVTTGAVSSALVGIYNDLIRKKLKALGIDPSQKLTGGMVTPYLSYKQLSDIIDKDMAKFHPYIEINGTQYPLFKNKQDTVKIPVETTNADGTVSVSMETKSNARDHKNKGSLTAGSPMISSPSYMGVSALANLTISQGDGASVVEMLLNEMTQNLNTGAIYVYDGILYHPSDISAGSQISNQGVKNAVEKGAFTTIVNSLVKSMEAISEYDFDSMAPDIRSKIEKEMRVDVMWGESISERLALIQDAHLEAMVDRAAEQERVLEAVKEIDSSWDQMASIAESLSVESPQGFETNSTEETLELLRNMVQEGIDERASREPEAKTKAPEVSEIDTLKSKKGTVRTLSNKDLNSLLHKMTNRPMKQLMWSMMRSGALGGNAKESIIKVGAADKLKEALRNDLMKSLSESNPELSRNEMTKTVDEYVADAFSEGTNGFYEPLTKFVYLINPSEKTLVHELIHRAISSKLLAYVNGDIKPGSLDHVAMQNIEKLYERFNHIIESASDDETNYMSIDLPFGVRKYLAQRRQTENRLATKSVTETDAKFIQLNEFIAWGLTDPDMRAMLEQTNTQGTGISKFSQLRKIASDVLDNVLSMIFGDRAGTVRQLLRRQSNFLGALELNTQLLLTDTGIERQSKAQASKNVLHHKVIVDDELSHVYEPLVRAWKNIERNPSYVAATDADSALNKLRPNDVKTLELSKAIMLAESVTNKVASAGFLTDPKEIEAFRHISKFLALGKEVDGLAMQGAQRVFEKVMEKLEVTDFLPENPTQHDYDVAQLKYNTLLGSGIEGVTANDQSPILNNFFALTLVNEEFRNLVDKLGVVEQQRIVRDQGVDTAIGSFGNTLIDKITNGLLKTDLSDSASLQIINLFNNITTTPEGAVAGGIKAASSTFEQVMNVADDYVASGVEKALNAVGSLPKMQAFKAVASAIKSDANADALADDMLNTASQWKMPQFLKEFIWDIGGRTQTNKNVYDMMKQVRSYIQRRRQLLLENLPEILKKKVPDATQEQLENFTSTMMGLDVGSLSFSEWKSAVLDVNDRQRLIDGLYNQLNHYDADSLSKIYDLARFIADKHSMPVGNSINAHNIVVARAGFTDNVYRREMDIVNRIATLEAMDILPQDDVAAILRVNEEGMKFLHGALRAKTQGEMNSLTDNYETFKTKSDLGYIKGNVPAHRDGNEHFINVANTDAAIKKAEERGYTLMERVGTTAVMFSNSPSKAPFSQGIGQNAVQHIGNMRLTNPTSMGPDYVFVGNTQQPISATSINALVREKDITKLLGVSQSRREEEVRGTMINRELVKNLKSMYDNRGGTRDSYINILDPRELSKNPILKDAVNILGKEIKDEAKLQFGRDNVLMVRKDLLNQVVGYRGGSVADFWNGTNRLPPQVNAAVSSFAEGILGKDAMSKLLKVQAIHENLIADAKSLIVAKSFIVSGVNAISNAYHLMSLGVPVSEIITKTPRKVAEIETYVKGTLREIEVETALVSATTAAERQKYRAELQSIKDSYKSLSIWPLIERGEFSTVTKDTISREDLLLTQGKFTSFMESKMSKWPKWSKELGGNVIITKNSPVYEGLQKFVDYGDFVAKALMYDHLTNNSKMSKEKALGEITEEFINYDLLPGRFRGTMERLGLLWFYNFKIRSTKIAMRRLRKNPVRSLLVANMPHIDVFGSIGVPINDNIFYKAADGSLLYSVGPEMGINSPFMHPAVNALDSLFN